MASVLKVDKLDPQSGTALEIGTSGDTVTVPTGAGLTVTDEVKTNKISPATGTAFALGDSGDTFTVPSGVTLDVASGATLDTTGATVTGITGANLVKITSGSLSGGESTCSITGCFTSTYEIYKIFLYDWNGSLGNAPYLRWYTGAATEETGAGTYFYAGVGYNTDGQGSSWSGNDDIMQIAGESFLADADDMFGWEGTLYNPAGTVMKKRLVFAGGAVRSGPYTFSTNGTGEWDGTTAITGFKIWPSGGTFDSLSYAVYGLVT